MKNCNGKKVHFCNMCEHFRFYLHKDAHSAADKEWDNFVCLEQGRVISSDMYDEISGSCLLPDWEEPDVARILLGESLPDNGGS